MTDGNELNLFTENTIHRTWVRETLFGRWFLRSDIWFKYVLTQAVLDFVGLAGNHLMSQPRVLDAGCGEGLSFGLLASHFKPSSILGVDIDFNQLSRSCKRREALTVPVQVLHADISDGLPIASNSFDLVFCHQLLHHSSRQSEILEEFYRLLKPGGVLLVGESCRSFIRTLPVRLLFKHPSFAQKDALGYCDLIRASGFEFTDSDVLLSRPWWSRKCFGLAQKIGISNSKEASEVLVVCRKPYVD